MRSVALAFLVILVATGAWAHNEAYDPRFEAVEIVDFQMRATVDVFYECVPLCEIPAGWSVINGGTDPAGYSWDNPFLCGTGVVVCPPDDPVDARCFHCPYGGSGELQDEWLISPPFDASMVTTLTLSFAHGVNYWSYCTHPNYIHLSTDGVNWTPVWTMPCTATYLDATIYYENVDVSAFAGEPVLYMAVQYQGDWAESWWFDDILFSGDDVSPVEESSWSTLKGIYR